MDPERLIERGIEREFSFSASRSSGPGGQNVNKVNTRVEIRFNIMQSSVLAESEKRMILENIKRKINTAGELIVTSQSERTQMKNRERATKKLLAIISESLAEKSERKPTRPTGRSKAERLEEKRRRGMKKLLRKDLNENDE
jgi:ribosome-associated protein